MDSQQTGNDNKQGPLDTAQAAHEVQAAFDKGGAQAAYLKFVEEVNTFKKTNHDLTDQRVFAATIEDGDLNNEQVSGQIQMEWMRANFEKIAGSNKNEITKNEIVAFAKGAKDPLDRAMVGEFVDVGYGQVNLGFDAAAKHSGSDDTIDLTDITLHESQRGPISNMQLEGDLVRAAQWIVNNKDYAPGNGFLTIPSINEQLKKTGLPQSVRDGLQYVKDNFDMLDHARYDFMIYSRGVNGKDLAARSEELAPVELEMRLLISRVQERNRDPFELREPSSLR